MRTEPKVYINNISQKNCKITSAVRLKFFENNLAWLTKEIKKLHILFVDAISFHLLFKVQTKESIPSLPYFITNLVFNVI